MTTATVAATPTLRQRAARTFESLRIREFRYLASGTLAANLSFWAHQIGTGWLVYDLTDSAAMLGTVTFASGLTGLIATPVGGLLADRASRARVVILPALTSTGLGTLTAALVLFDAIAIWQVFVLGVLGAITNAISLPARQALVHDVTTPETLPNAVALNSLMQNVARLGGPPLFGLLAAGSTAGPFLAVAALHLFEAAAMAPLGLRARHAAGKLSRRPFHDLIDGFRYVASERALLSLFLIVLVLSLTAYGYIALIPVFSEEVLGAGARGYGLLAAMAGLGSIVGLLVLASVQVTHHRGALMAGSFAIHVAFVGAFSQSEHLLVAMAFLAVGGAFLGIAFALFQLLVSDDMRGRALAVAGMASQVLTVSALPMGLTVAAIGVQAGILAHVVLGAALLILVATVRPEWRDL
jgi:MFS family permease